MSAQPARVTKKIHKQKKLIKSDKEVDPYSNFRYPNADAIIYELINFIRNVPEFGDLLVKNLISSAEHSYALEKDLREALTWPTNLDAYYVYLKEYVRWTPIQRPGPWVVDGEYKQSKEIYDRLCHFHFLISSHEKNNGTIFSKKDVQDHPWFSEWLVRFSQQWGLYLDTPESFTVESFRSFLSPLSSDYHVRDSICWDEQRGEYRPNEPSGWRTFNQFFARTLNAGMRPVKGENNNTQIVAPADCQYKQQYQINEDNTIDEIVIKYTHKYANISKLLDFGKYHDQFAGGTYVHYFLGPNDYHRFHSPVSGQIVECKNVYGKTMLDVNIVGDQFDAPDNEDQGYEFFQARGILIVDTSKSASNVGLVAVIPVGMSQVSSVVMHGDDGDLDGSERHIQKGDEFGYFQFGGSDIIMLFQKDVVENLSREEIHYLYGQQVGNLNTLSKSNNAANQNQA